MKFEGERGAAFFRSTLVQTLFYGVFSAWVLWARQTPAPTGPFDWRTSVWHLRAPVLRALFQQLSDPGRLQPLGLVEVLDWTAAALDRVDRPCLLREVQRGRGGAILLRSPSWRPSTRPCAASWASGTPPLRWSATWWPGLTAPSGTIWASRTGWPPGTSTSSTPAAAPGPTWPRP